MRTGLRDRSASGSLALVAQSVPWDSSMGEAGPRKVAHGQADVPPAHGEQREARKTRGRSGLALTSK
jgi:hypothetical protein